VPLEPPAHRRHRWRDALFVAVALGVFAALSLGSAAQESATFDEAIHLPPGYAALSFGDYWVEPFHPPLARALAALPLLALDVEADPGSPLLARRRAWAFAHRFLYVWNDADRLLFWGRLPILALAMALAVAVFAWTRRHWGAPAAWAALGLCVLDPDLLAHSHAVTTDVAVTLWVFVAVVAFERLSAHPSWARLLGAGAAFGCALASKFSAVVLGPLIVALGLLEILAAALRRRAAARSAAAARGDAGEPAARSAHRADGESTAGPGGGTEPVAPAPRGSAARDLLRLGARLVAMGLITVAVLWAAHGFRRAPNEAQPGAAVAYSWEAVRLQSPLLQGGIELARDSSLLPHPWVYGLAYLLAGKHGGTAFLFGEESTRGWWYYFPATIALKTPLALLLLVAAALAALAHRAWRHRDPPAAAAPGDGTPAAGREPQGAPAPTTWRLEAYVWVPVVFWLVVAMASGVNIGHRHILPIYPFLFVAAGRVVAAAWTSRRAVGRLAAAVLLTWYAGSTLRSWPHFLTHFNELGGGPRQGWRHLVDSNSDWGQGLPGLRRWMSEERVERLHLLYFGSADPRYHGITASRLPGFLPPLRERPVWSVAPGDLVAVSATHLQGLYLDPALDPLVARLREREPVAMVGGSIFVYRSDFAWVAPREARGRQTRPLD
jgi:hypothetical protein